MTDEYLWDRSGEGDDFLRALERRLAPLDEAEQIMASLELERSADQAEVEHAGLARQEARDEVVSLRPRPPEASSPADAPRSSETRRALGRGWPWLAAAVAVLAVSVGSLFGSPRLAAPSTLLHVGGSGDARVRRVTLAADRLATLAALRPAHDSLARCVAELAPAEPLELELDAEGPRVTAPADARDAQDEALLGCVREAIDELDGESLGRTRVSIEPR